MDGGDDEGCGFECNICLTLAQDPVITLCGHLYCWSCLIKWLFNSPYSNNECPVCKTDIEFSKLIFSYRNLKSSESDTLSRFECNICSRLAQEPIITLCGHLYCWPCIYKWLSKWNSDSNCWVCKAVIEENKLIPLYGKGITCSSHDDSDSRSRAVVPAVIAGSLASTTKVNRFVRGSFDATGTLFRFGRYTMEIFMTRVLPIVAILLMFHPSMPKERKHDLVEKVFGLSLWCLLILVVWDILRGKIRRHNKLEH